MGILEVRAGGQAVPTSGWAFRSDGAYLMIDVDGLKQRGPCKVYPSLEAMRTHTGPQAHFESRELDKVPQEVCALIVNAAHLVGRTGQNVAAHYFGQSMPESGSGNPGLERGGASHSCDE